MVSEYTIQVLTLVVDIGGTIFLGLIAAILLEIAREDKFRGDKAEMKADEVKQTLKSSSENLAQESTLRELAKKSEHV